MKQGEGKRHFVALLPLRGESKGIPDKNIKLFAGKPLTFWVLEALEKSKIEKIIVATDSSKIINVIKKANFSKVTFYNRSPESATDTAPTELVLLEVIQNYDFSDEDILILVQATSPFTTFKDINGALEQFKKKKYQGSILSVVEFKRFLWNKEGKPLNYDYLNRPRRQDFEGYYLENGAFYVNTIGNIIENKNRLSEPINFWVMPDFTSIELDEKTDWLIAEKIMKKMVLKED